MTAAANPTEQLLALALAMQEAGCSLVPVSQDKKPNVVSWKQYQERCASRPRLREWAADPQTTGFAVVCGKVSRNLEVLDFDDPVMYGHFLGSLPEWADGITFPTQQTGGGGYQVAYRRSGGVPGNQKLAWSPAVDADGVVIEGRPQIGIETRGEGGYAVIPYSLHPTGNRYQPTLGSWSDIPKITHEQAEELLALARSFDQTPKPEPLPAAPALPVKGTVSSGGQGADPLALTVEKAVGRYVEKAVEHELAKVQDTGKGGRNDQLNKAAFALGQLVGAGELDQAEAIKGLRAAARAAGMDEKNDGITPTIQSGLSKGAQQPRDLSRIRADAREWAEKKSIKVGKSAPIALTKTAEALAEQQAAGEGLPTAEQIPEPEGEGGAYSSGQVKQLLGITWPVTAAHTDLAHAYRLYDLAGDDLAYVPALGGYVSWNGQQWLDSASKDGAGQTEAKRRAQKIGVTMWPEVGRLLALYGVLAQAAAATEARSGRDSAEAREARNKADAMQKAYFQLERAAQQTEQDTRQKAILSSAATIYMELNPKKPQDFEPRQWVVGFPNGVWDRGTWRPARREDHMLKLAAVAYQPDADRADWLAVLDRITGGDTDLQLTLQQVAGYALSGASSLRLLPWLYGEGGTGKGTYSEMLATVLGELAETISPKHLATDADRERLGAVIWGKRVALCAEAGNARLDAESLKTLSGGDRLAVRRLYAESFTGRASHVLLMVANDAPRVEAYDDALKDRVLALPFTHPLKLGGPLLGGRRLEELRQDASSPLVLGFAAWAVDGLADVYAAGDIHRAGVCQSATRTFWSEVDPLRDFWPLLDRSALAVDGIAVAQVRAMYEQWTKDTGTRAMTSHKFNRAAKSVGLEQSTPKKMRVWKLVHADKFPAALEAGQGEAGESCNGKTDLIPNSVKPSKINGSCSFRRL